MSEKCDQCVVPVVCFCLFKRGFPVCLTGHAIFKLTYLSNHDYKPLYFESDAATVNEIVLKVSLTGCLCCVRFLFSKDRLSLEKKSLGPILSIYGAKSKVQGERSTGVCPRPLSYLDIASSDHHQSFK